MSGPHSLPPGLGRSREEIVDPDAFEATAAAMLAAANAGILAGVGARGAAFVIAGVDGILAAWGRCPADVRDRTAAAIRAEADAIVAEVQARLEALFATDVEHQRATPLEVVRGLVARPTELLAAAGIPPVARDEHEERMLPDDHYGLAPRSLGDLGDDDLAALMLAWGLAKANVIRARRARRAGEAPRGGSGPRA